jgi:hypothetical protein
VAIDRVCGSKVREIGETVLQELEKIVSDSVPFVPEGG